MPRIMLPYQDDLEVKSSTLKLGLKVRLGLVYRNKEKVQEG